MNKIIDKIKKLLALSKSSNPHEAALALEKAMTLMKEYQLNEVDLVNSAIGEDSCRAGNTQKLPIYVMGLARLVADTFSCEFYISQAIKPNYDRTLYVTNVVFVGFNSNQSLATYCFNNLLPKLKKARSNCKSRSRLPKRILADKDTYAVGWVSGIHTKLFHLIPDKPTIEVSGETGIVKVNPLVQYVESITDCEIDAIDREGKSKYGYLGYRDGLKVDVHKPLNNQDRVQLQAQIR